MVDDPDFPEVVHAEDDLIEFGAVVDRVGVIPVGPAVHHVVEIDQLGMVGHDAVVFLGEIVVLDQVVPSLPLPDDVAGGGPGGLDFDDAVGPQLAVAKQRGVAARGDGLGLALHLPGDQQDVSIGQDLDVVVLEMRGAGVFVRPGDVSVPVDRLHDPSRAADFEGRVADVTRVQQFAVFEQVHRVAGPVVGSPGVDDVAVVVHQVGGRRAQRREQVVALERLALFRDFDGGRVGVDGPVVIGNLEADGEGPGRRSGEARRGAGGVVVLAIVVQVPLVERDRAVRVGRGRAVERDRRVDVTRVGAAGLGRGRLVDYDGIGIQHDSEADVVVGVVGIIGAAVVGRVAVGHAAVAPILLPVVPVAAAEHLIGVAVGHGVAGGGAGGVVRRAYIVVVAAVPVIGPLPDVARHVVQAVGARSVGGLIGLLAAGPVEVRRIVQVAVVEADRGRPGKVARLVWVGRVGPVGQRSVRVLVVAPGEDVVILTAAGGVLPFGLGRQPVAAVGEVALPGGQIVAGLVSRQFAEPVRVGGGPVPADADHGVVLSTFDHGERAAVELDAAVRNGGARLSIDMAPTDAVDVAANDLDQALRQGRIEVIAVLLVGDLGGAHRERVDDDVVQRHFVALVLQPTQIVVVSHLELTGGNRHDRRDVHTNDRIGIRRGGCGHGIGCGATRIVGCRDVVGHGGSGRQ